MENKVLTQKELVKKLQNSEDVSSYTLVFNEEKVEALEAILLGKNGFNVPEELIYYNDEAINYSDDPELTDDDFESGNIKWLLKPQLALDKEITDWIDKEKIDLNRLIPYLLKNFYQSIKFVQKNTAI